VKKLIVSLSLVVCVAAIIVSCTTVDTGTGEHVVDPKLEAGLAVGGAAAATAPQPWGLIGTAVVTSISTIALGIAQFKNRKK